jgi:hypothetical protein
MGLLLYFLAMPLEHKNVLQSLYIRQQLFRKRIAAFSHANQVQHYKNLNLIAAKRVAFGVHHKPNLKIQIQLKNSLTLTKIKNLNYFYQM